MGLQQDLNMELLNKIGLYKYFISAEQHTKDNLIAITLDFVMKANMPIDKMNKRQLIFMRADILIKLGRG